MADFLDEMLAGQTEAETPAPVEEAPVQEETPQENVEAVQPAPNPEPQEQRGGGFVPIDAMLSEREKRQAAERELETLRQTQQKPATDVPDPFDDPQGYAAYNREQIEQQTTALRFQFSDQFARQVHGAEAVDAAAAWAQEKAKANPAFAMSYMREQNPIDWIVREHKRDALLSDIGDNVDGWFTREAAKRGYAMQSASTQAAPVVVAATPAPKPAMPPRSIASDATPTRDAASENPMASMDAIFNRR